jgi:subtilisin family serine protease
MMTVARRWALVLLVAAAGLAVGQPLAEGANEPRRLDALEREAAVVRGVDPEVREALHAGPVEAFVVFDDGRWRAAARDERARRGLVENDAALLEATRAELAALKAAAGPLDVVQDYPNLSVQLVRFTSVEELEAVVRQPAVAAVRQVGVRRPFLAESLVLIRQPQAASAGFTGASVAVAVIDTGVDYRRPAFGCTAVNTPAGTCKVVYARDFAPDDGQLDHDGHGTNVAGIVVGVAPAAKIVALDVFRGDVARDSDLLAALDWTIANRATYNIRAVNLSLGDDAHAAAPCTWSVYTSIFASLRNAGILPIVAAGNSAYVNGRYVDGLAEPACAPGAVSVGAVYDSASGAFNAGTCRDLTTAADQVPCFSQSAAYLRVLAPGAMITAAGITMAGTSQAAPHVAGLVALLAAAHPTGGTTSWDLALARGGKPIRDPRNGVTTNRMDAYNAVCSVATCSGPPPPMAVRALSITSVIVRDPVRPMADPPPVPTFVPTATPIPGYRSPTARSSPSAFPTLTPTATATSTATARLFGP